MDRSACGVMRSAPIYPLFPYTTLFRSDGGATVAVLASVPVSVGLMAIVSVKLAVPPVARVPVVLGRAHVWTPVTARPRMASTAVHKGSTSETVAPVTVLGPLLVTVMV